MPKPTVLYKYRGPGRINDLRSLSVRFTPPGKFNDPFEALVAVKGAFAPASVEQLVALTHAEAAKDRAIVAEEEVRAELEGGNLKSRSVAPGIISKLTNETFGVLSLSEPCDDILMWSHYAASHSGFLIGFDTSHPWFDQREHESEVINCLKAVEYTRERPGVYLSDATYSRDADSARLAAEIFLRKSDHWSYEREWRIVRSLKDADETIGGEVHLFQVPPDAVLEVILGWNADYGTRAAVREVLDDPRLNHVRLRRTRLSDSDYAVEVIDC